MSEAPMNVSTVASTPRSVAPAGRAPSDPRLWRAAQEFQEVFMAQFVRGMRTSEAQSDLFEDSAGRDVFDSMLSDAIGRQIAQRDSAGLTSELYRALGGKFAKEPAKPNVPGILPSGVNHAP